MGIHPAFFLTDQEGHWCHLDQGWQALTGTTADQALGVGWQSFIHPQERQRVVAEWQAGILAQSRFSLTYPLAHTEGRYRTVHHTVSPRPGGYMGSLDLEAVEPQGGDQALTLLDLMFAQSLEGLFLMLMDQPLEWHDGIDKEATLDYAMTHQHLVRVNGAMADQYGCTAVEFLGRTPAELFAHDLDYGRQIFREFLDAGWLSNETQERRADGSQMLIQGNYVCLYDSQGRILGHFGTQREVTEQKKKENDYRHQELLMQKILDATPNAVYIFDLSSYQNIYANSCVMRILGYTPEEVMALGSSLLVDHIHPEDWPRVQLHLGRCLQMDDQMVAEIEYRFQRPDGSWCWLYSRDVIFGRTDSGQVQQILGVLQDITERKRIQLALLNSEARLSQLFDNVPVVVYRYVMDPDGGEAFAYLSGAVTEIYEVPAPEGISSAHAIWSRVHPEDIPGLVASIQSSAQTLQPWQADHRLLMPDGRIKWISSRSTPQRQEDGSIVWDGVTLDITERRQAEIALSNSENRFRNMAANVPGAIFQYVLHPNGSDQVVYMSQSCQAIWEVKAAAVELDSQILWDMVHLEDRDGVIKSLLLSADSLDPWRWTWRITTPSGQLKWLEASGRPRRLDNGDILWDSLILDITARKLGDRALEVSQRQFQSLVENSPDIIERFDLDLKHLYVSSTLVKTTGLATDDFIGKTCRDMQMDPKMVDCFEKATEQVLATGQTQRIELTTPTVNGIREFEMSVSPERDSEGSIESFLCISRDVTAYKEVTNALSASERQLQSLITNLPGALLKCLNDRDYTALYISEGVMAITGYAAEDFISGRIHLGSLIDPLDEPRVWHTISNGIEVSNFYEVEYKIRAQNGDCKWVLDRGQGIYDETGALLYLETFISDITNLKLAELSLQQQVLREQTLNRVIRSIRDSLDLDTIFATATQEVGILLTLQSCVIVRHEPELKVWRHLTEYLSTPEQVSFINVDIPDEDNPFSTQLKHQQIVQFKTLDIIDDVNRDLLQDLNGSLLLVPIVVEGVTWGSFSLYRQDLSYCWTEETIRLIQAITDQLAIGIQQAQLHHQLQTLNQSLSSKVEKRTAQLQKAFEAESLLRHVAEQVRNSLDEDVILKTVVDTLGERLSLLFCNICTYNDDAVFPRYVFQRTHLPLPQLILPMREYPWVYDTLRRGHASYFSTCLEGLWVTLFIAPVQDDLCALGDILVMRMGHESFQPSEIRLVEQVANQCSIALRQSRLFTAVQDQVQELHRLNNLKDDFLSTVSHELRSPMANIKMATRMLEVNLERISIPANVRHYIQILEEEGDREINLINDLLDLARLEADTPQLNLSKMDLNELIQALIRPLESRFKTQQQRFDIQIAPDVSLITTDVTYLERILGELLHNACKYTPAGETILIDIQTSATLQIQVINTGVEIPVHEYDRIFDKFYRVPHNDPWKHGGTGLGLALVKRMVRALGGKIEVSSSNNSTCFDVSLPLL